MSLFSLDADGNMVELPLKYPSENKKPAVSTESHFGKMVVSGPDTGLFHLSWLAGPSIGGNTSNKVMGPRRISRGAPKVSRM